MASDLMPNGSLSALLSEPFEVGDVEWRLQQSGVKQDGEIWAICLPYITARAIQDRLDQAVGVLNWYNEFKEGPSGGVLCGISIRCGDTWVTKWDGAENTGKREGAPDDMAVKGGLSGAFKRAAVQWGIGRYLYRLDATFARISEQGKNRGVAKVRGEGNREQKHRFRWDPPDLPSWARPKARKSEETPAKAPAQATAPARTSAPPPAAKAPEPTCPSCGGAMWNNLQRKAEGKMKSTAPDYKCKRGECEGCYWPGQWPPKDEDKSQAAAKPAPKKGSAEEFEDFPRELEGDDDLPF